MFCLIKINNSQSIQTVNGWWRKDLPTHQKVYARFKCSFRENRKFHEKNNTTFKEGISPREKQAVCLR